MKVSIFIPCFIDQLFPQTAINMCTVLQKVGCQIDYNPTQTCCGQPAFNAGFLKEAKAVATKFVNDFSAAPIIVCPSASCVGFVRNYLGTILERTDAALAKEISKNIFEFSEFLTEYCDISKLNPTYTGKAIYHDSCAALRECKIKAAPQKLLNLVKGLEILENPKSEDCCGFGGTFSIKYEPISVAMAAQKVEVAIEAGADCIISTDLSCLMHLQAYIDQQKLAIKTLHIADVLVS